jgi:hypothetical protein
VPHGLRHQDAADAYRALTGQPPPVAGGGAVDQVARCHQEQIQTQPVRPLAWRIEHDGSEPIVLKP